MMLLDFILLPRGIHLLACFYTFSVFINNIVLPVYDTYIMKKNCIYLSLPLFLEKAMAPHSSTLAWKIPWMEEPGGLQSMGSLRVGHD